MVPRSREASELPELKSTLMMVDWVRGGREAEGWLGGKGKRDFSNLDEEDVTAADMAMLDILGKGTWNECVKLTIIKSPHPTCCFALIAGLDLKSLTPEVVTEVCSFFSRICDLRKGILGRRRCRGARGRNWGHYILHPSRHWAQGCHRRRYTEK